MNMLDMRRRAIIAASGFTLPAYTGTYNLVGDKTQGYIELLTDGVLTLAPWVYDLCLVGGGTSGMKTAPRNAHGGYLHNIIGVTLSGELMAAIGAGGAKTTTYSINDGSSSTLGEYTSADGVVGGSNAAFMSAAGGGQPGGSGANPFGDVNFTAIAGGGGGGGRINVSSGSASSGAGTDGGGNGGAVISGVAQDGSDGISNTGGGGGNGGLVYYQSAFRSTGLGGAGGSGIIIVRWGY